MGAGANADNLTAVSDREVWGSQAEQRAARRAEPHVVYRLFGSDDVMIYVGLSAARNLGSRLRAHRRRSWWDEVRRAETTWHPSFESAAAIEAGLVRTGQPRHNRRVTTRF